MTSEAILIIVITAVVTAAATWLVNFILDGAKGKSSSAIKKQEALERGVQALLRSNLYQLYDRCVTQGYVTERDLANFENMYAQYHNLGKNGVMDRYRDEFRNIPICENVIHSDHTNK